MSVGMKQKEAKEKCIEYSLLAILCIATAIYFALQYMKFGAIILFMNSWNGSVIWSTGWFSPFVGIFGFVFASILLTWHSTQIYKKYFLK